MNENERNFEKLLKQEIAGRNVKIEQLKAELAAKTCEWKHEPDDMMDEYYETGCGQAFCMMEGTPEDNKFKYCTYCGGKIVPPLPKSTSKPIKSEDYRLNNYPGEKP